jgi:alpha-tubulin suppressor-like RCC1 family protein
VNVGNLGLGDVSTRTTPVQIPDLSLGGTGAAVVAAQGGALNTFALSSDGTATAFGNNPSGQFGDGTLAGSLTPVPGLTSLTDVSAIAAAPSPHTLALTSERRGLGVWLGRQRPAGSGLGRHPVDLCPRASGDRDGHSPLGFSVHALRASRGA